MYLGAVRRQWRERPETDHKAEVSARPLLSLLRVIGRCPTTLYKRRSYHGSIIESAKRHILLQNSKLATANFSPKSDFCKNRNHIACITFSGPHTARSRSVGRPPSQKFEKPAHAAEIHQPAAKIEFCNRILLKAAINNLPNKIEGMLISSLTNMEKNHEIIQKTNNTNRALE